MKKMFGNHIPDPNVNPNPIYILNEYELDYLALEYSYIKLNIKKNTNYMISYQKNDIRLNFWLTTGSVGSYLCHPTKRKTQLFRKDISIELCEEIFKNPRIHTG